MKSHLNAIWFWLHSKRHRIYLNTIWIWLKSYSHTTWIERLAFLSVQTKLNNSLFAWSTGVLVTELDLKFARQREIPRTFRSEVKFAECPSSMGELLYRGCCFILPILWLACVCNHRMGSTGRRFVSILLLILIDSKSVVPCTSKTDKRRRWLSLPTSTLRRQLHWVFTSGKPEA